MVSNAAKDPLLTVHLSRFPFRLGNVEDASKDKQEDFCLIFFIKKHQTMSSRIVSGNMAAVATNILDI